MALRSAFRAAATPLSKTSMKNMLPSASHNISPFLLQLDRTAGLRRSRQSAAEVMEASTSKSADLPTSNGKKSVGKGGKLIQNGPSAAAQTQAAATAAAPPTASPGHQAIPKIVPVDLRHEVDADGVHTFTIQASAAAIAARPRLDAILTSSIPSITRSKILHCIKDGLVTVNGKPVTKGGHKVKVGDALTCRVPPPPPLEATPESIPLDVVYEDEHLLLVNKPAGMVVHPAPGLSSGTLVNALLHHCGLPAMRFLSGNPPLPKSLNTTPELASTSGQDTPEETSEEEDVAEELEDGEDPILGSWTPMITAGPAPVIRPGIVHRIDKGTTGLLVVSKDEATHADLCRQFEARTTHRLYWSITVGVPKDPEGRVQTHIDRDPKDFRRMTWFPAGGHKGKHAASNYKVVEILAGGGAALVQWKLETGRTHQIRVHAKFLGHPLLGDDAYGGAGTGAAQVVARGGGQLKRIAAAEAIRALGRPALHAKTLAFTHPVTLEKLQFDSEPPMDFLAAIEALRRIN